MAIDMGCVCSDQGSKDTWAPPRLEKLRISNLEDLVINPGAFVQENSNSFHDVYELTSNLLGQGNYTEVRECIHRRNGACRAVKIIHKVGVPRKVLKSKALLREVEVLKGLTHPNIVRIFEFFEDLTHYYIVMELCRGCELFDMVTISRRLDESKAARVMEQLLSSVAYCHSMNVVHRDLKPENLIVEERGDSLVVKLIDFDSATYFEVSKQVHGAYGTTFYMAPEVIEGSYDEKCDVWSAGVILYVLLSGRPPFIGLTDTEVQCAILDAKVSISGAEWSLVSSEAKELLLRMLTRDPRRRISAQEAYLHSWIQNKAPKSDPDPQLMSEVLLNLREFQTTNKIKSAVRTFIIGQIIDSKDVAELRQVFQAIDVNGDGHISEEELVAQFCRVMSPEQAVAEVQAVMKSLQLRPGGLIDYRMFLLATADKRKLMSEANLIATFSLFDQKDRGCITSQELRTLLSDGNLLEDSLWQRVMQDLDREGKGTIQLHEFLREMSGHTTQDEEGDISLDEPLRLRSPSWSLPVT